MGSTLLTELCSRIAPDNGHCRDRRRFKDLPATYGAGTSTRVAYELHGLEAAGPRRVEANFGSRQLPRLPRLRISSIQRARFFSSAKVSP